MKFSDRLRKYIDDNKMQQKELAKKCNVSNATLSGILCDRRTVNLELLVGLSEISGKSINWWLFGTDNYNNLYSLNELINFFIRNGDIKEKNKIDDATMQILVTMLQKEINTKLDNLKEEG